MHKHHAEHPRKDVQQSSRGLVTFMAGALLVLVPFAVEHLGYTGDVMIAAPKVKAPFDRSLVLIDQHGVEGAVGIVINKPLLPEQRAQLSPFIRDENIPVSYGGPLETTEKLLVLEEKQPKKAGDKPIFDLEFWDDAVRLEPDLMRRIRESLANGEQRYRVFAGYAYWSPFQLESEVLVNDEWGAVAATHAIVFQTGDEKGWDALEQRKESKKHPDANQS